MPVTPYNQVHPGALVTVVMQADQATGRQVQGIVGDVLTKHDDSRGVEVRLTDGRVGRVQEVLSPANASHFPSTQSQQYNTAVADPQNWQAHTSFPSGHPSSHTQHTPVPDPQNWQAHTSFPSGHPSSHTQHSHSPVPDPQNWQAHTSFPSGHSPYAQPQRPQNAASRPSQAPLLDDSPNLPPEERNEQLEYMQSYEDSIPASEDDRNQAILQREFPDIDSSLIAAIYGDSKSLRTTREMLQELKD